MHATGHVGVGFAAAAPLVLALDGLGLGGLAIPTTAVLVGLSTLPDCDEFVPGTTHRGGTHSLFFAVVVGLGASGLGWLTGPVFGGDPAVVAALWFGVGALAVCCHVLADVVTPMGVYPLWPLSADRRSLALVRSADARVNRALLVTGVGGWLLATAVASTF